MVKTIHNRNLEIIINTLFHHINTVCAIQFFCKFCLLLLENHWLCLGKISNISFVWYFNITTLEQLYSFLLTLTVSSTESDICGRLTNACILFTSVSSNEVWNNSISSLSSVVCAICLMDFSPNFRITYLICCNKEWDI